MRVREFDKFSPAFIESQRLKIKYHLYVEDPQIIKCYTVTEKAICSYAASIRGTPVYDYLADHTSFFLLQATLDSLAVETALSSFSLMTTPLVSDKVIGPTLEQNIKQLVDTVHGFTCAPFVFTEDHINLVFNEIRQALSSFELYFIYGMFTMNQIIFIAFVLTLCVYWDMDGTLPYLTDVDVKKVIGNTDSIPLILANGAISFYGSFFPDYEPYSVGPNCV